MFILGLTGSIGSGKSFVSSLLAKAGAVVICADSLAREAVAPGSPGLAEIVRHFGPAILASNGELDRSALARIVFADPSKRQLLESIVHPLVRARELELIEQNRHHPLVVLDVPLLFETGLDAHCDAVASVSIDEETRRRRLGEGRGMTPAQIEERLKTQMPQHEKNARATYVIDNSGTREETERQVAAMVRRMKDEG